MQVYRCDRCGNHYTQKEHNHTIDIFEVVDDRKEPRNLLCITTQTGRALDLCPDCMISLINWINSGGSTDGCKFGYEYAEDINFNKIRVGNIKEVKEDDNN